MLYTPALGQKLYDVHEPSQGYRFPPTFPYEPSLRERWLGRRPEEAAQHTHQHLSAGQWSRGWGFNARLAGQMVVSGAVEAGFRGGRGSGSVWWVGFEAHATSRAAA